MPSLDYAGVDSDFTSRLDELFTRTSSVSTGQKKAFDRVPAFYVGGELKQHFPYARDEDGKKIPKKGSSTAQQKDGYIEYEREATSDGWIFSLHTPGKDTLYVVVPEKPALEIGSLYFVSGLGYGRGQYPSFLDENVVIYQAAHLVPLDSEKRVLGEA